MGQIRIIYGIIVRKSLGKIPPERPGRKWKGNIKNNIRERG
jgi:hypothetical protein